MGFIKSLIVTLFAAPITFASLSPAVTSKAATTLSDIKNYNFICMHTEKPEALVFKTTVPYKAWRTTILANGEIKKGKAFELQNIQINAKAINLEGQVASFKAKLAKNYEIKGLFQKQVDDDLPLIVVTNYTLDTGLSQKKDNYNCLQEKSDAPPVVLGSIE